MSKDIAAADPAASTAKRGPARPRKTKVTSIAQLPDATPPEQVSDLAREYIGLAIAGGLVVGLALGVLMQAVPARKLRKRAGALATVAEDVALALAAQVIARANTLGREGRDRLGEFGDRLGDTLTDTAGEARDTSSRLVDEAASRLRSGGGRVRDSGSALGLKLARLVTYSLAALRR